MRLGSMDANQNLELESLSSLIPHSSKVRPLAGAKCPEMTTASLLDILFSGQIRIKTTLTACWQKVVGAVGKATHRSHSFEHGCSRAFIRPREPRFTNTTLCGIVCFMAEVRDFLSIDEKVYDKVVCFRPNQDVRYTIWTLAKNGTENEDDVILEIHKSTEPCVLIGGNPLELSVVSGFGHLATRDLRNGGTFDLLLEPGTKFTIPSDNTLYWYENKGTDPLFIRDHCEAFNFENEPTLEMVVKAFTGLPE
jgi:hypothetical protein